MNRTTAALTVGLLICVARPALAEDGGDEYGVELLSTSEIKRAELERKQAASPVLAVTPSYLRTTLQEGETKSLSLVVSNAGGRTLNWRAKSQSRTIRLDATSGSLGHEEGRRLWATLDARTTKPGRYRWVIEFEAADANGSPKTMSVVVIVEPKPKARPRSEVEPAPPPKPQPRARDVRDTPPTYRSLRQGRGRFGVRAGLMIPGSGSTKSFSSSTMLGLQYRFKLKSRSNLLLETAIDISSFDANDGSEEVGAYVGSCDVVFPFGERNGGRGYLLSGLGLLLDAATVDTSVISTLNLGGGYELLDRNLDFRLSHRILLGSNNVKGLTAITVGYSF
jgi:hypothetical protein